MTGHKLRCVNWQGTLKHKGVKQTSVKQGLGVHNKVSCFRPYNFIQTIQHTCAKEFFVRWSRDSNLVSISTWKMLMKPVFIPNILRFKMGKDTLCNQAHMRINCSICLTSLLNKQELWHWDNFMSNKNRYQYVTQGTKSTKISHFFFLIKNTYHIKHIYSVIFLLIKYT